uniref:Uncharacterized protein n=1 Tax=Meloidogyne floridensis TaxID=298350 RepID=A0A915NMC6_9BILA
METEDLSIKTEETQSDSEVIGEIVFSEINSTSTAIYDGHSTKAILEGIFKSNFSLCLLKFNAAISGDSAG